MGNKAREAELGAVIGMKGGGKSYKTWTRLLAYVRGDPANGILPRKCLIMDVNDEFGANDNGFPAVRAMYIKDVPRFNLLAQPQIRRIRPFKDNGKVMTIDEISECLFYILENYKGGVLLIEDPSRYIADSIPQDVIGAICTNRHRDIDIIMHFQLIGKISHPKIWGNLNWIRLHKIKGSVSRYDDKFDEAYEPLMIAESLVNHKYQSGDTYFHCYINTDNYAVAGNFSQDDFLTAINNYITDNYRRVISPLLKKVDINTGLPVYESSTAVSQYREKLFTEYFGN